MSVQTVTAPPNPATLEAAPSADGAAELAVLSHLLDAHPRRLTLARLADELGGRPGSFALRRAVANLSAAGFLTCRGQSLAAAPKVLALDGRLTAAG